MSIGISASPLGAYLQHERENLRASWWVFLLLGVISIIVGLVAVSSVFIATMATIALFGWLLVIEGVAQIFHAIMVRNWRGAGLHLAAAVLYLLTGVFMLEDPIKAATVITLLFAAAFFVGGVLRVVIAVSARFPSWQWVVLNGVVDVVLAGLIFRGWPESSLWVIGLFVGIDLIMHGWSSVLLGLMVRKIPADAAA